MLESFNCPVTLIGCGRMGGALLKGWRGKGLKETLVTVIDPGDFVIGKMKHIKNLSDFTGPLSGLVVLAVKPQQMSKLMDDIDVHGFKSGTVFVSVAAGVTIDSLKQGLNSDVKQAYIVRAMPNIAVVLGRSMTGLYHGTPLTDETRNMVENLIQSVGACLWLDHEDQMDAVTAIAGSGPAYVFHFVEALAAAAKEMGFSQSDALLLARETVIGAAGLLASVEGVDPAELRAQVTSPGGTTEAALEILMAGDGMNALVAKAAKAAQARSQALGA